MTFNILRVLIIALPFVLVPNEWDCFRNVKESIFQCGAILILASSFFDIKLRDYKNKYIMNKTPAQYLEKAGGAQTILNILL